MSNDAGNLILQKTVEFSKQLFCDRICSCYALGSLAHGGFSPLVSDVDIAIILKNSLWQSDAETISNIQKNIAQTKLPLSDRLSIFWGSVESLENNQGGRFPALDKLDLIEHGRLLFGNDIRLLLSKPNERDLIIMGAQFSLAYLCKAETIHEIKRSKT